MTIEDLAKSSGIWGFELKKDDSDIVLKSSIRFYRNVDGYPFSHRLGKKEKEKVNKLILHSIEKNNYCSDFSVFNIYDLSNSDKRIFFERNILKDDNHNENIVVLSKDQNYYFILNSEDHIEFITIQSGFHFDDIYLYGKRVIQNLEVQLDFSFSKTFGYLTAHPESSGPGMEMITTLHLSGLILLNRINEVVIELEKKGLGLRSSWIDGYYEIYNKYSMGFVEKEFYKRSINKFQKVIQREREARELAYSVNKSLVEDRVWRSYGILLSTRLISLFEALDLLSQLRLGVSLGIIDYLSIRDINLSLYYLHDFHLKRIYHIAEDNKNLDEVRAQFLRDYFKEVT